MTDVEHMEEAYRRAVACLEQDAGRLWGSVEPRWIFCTNEWWYLTQEVPTAMPVGALWRIPAPQGLTANTSVEFQGRWWAQIHDVERAGEQMDVLMVHELFHATVQRERGLIRALPSAGVELTTVDGKALFFAEIRACR